MFGYMFQGRKEVDYFANGARISAKTVEKKYVKEKKMSMFCCVRTDGRRPQPEFGLLNQFCQFF